MEGKLDEIDRGRLKADHDVMVRLDALPEITFPAKLSQVSPMTVMDGNGHPREPFAGTPSWAKSMTVCVRE